MSNYFFIIIKNNLKKNIYDKIIYFRTILKQVELLKKIVRCVSRSVDSIMKRDPALAACYIESLTVLTDFKGRIIKEN